MVVLSLLGSQVLAAESSPVVSARDVATLVTNRDAAGPDQTLSVGLHLKLKPGWHTYWLNPGDAGEAPTLKVTASGGQTGMSGALHFPTPVRIADGGLMSYAYVGEVTLPATLALHGTGGTTLKAHAEWLVCANTCVPESGDFTLDLPGAARDPGPGAQEPLFAQAMAAMPQPSPFTARFAPDGGLTLTGAGLSPETAKQAWFMPSVPGVIDQVAAQSLHVSDGRLTLTLKWLQRAPKTLSGIVVIRDASGQGSALWIDAGPGGAVPRDGGALPRLLGLAFLGGLILNLMPCVFPVLAMKAFSVVKIGGVARRRALMSAGAYAAGVMGSFAALGGLLLALRAAGAAAGWGFQFQSPVFVVGVCWLLLIMALNLLGAFEVTTRLGQDVPPRHGLAGDALTGLLAVVVASPCTAPFMGAAIAGALGGPVWGALAIFLAMGLGLAFPYVLIAGVPAIAARLPRPGAWMDVLRQFLAFPLLATCVWLLWVAEVQGGAAIMVLAAGGGVALGLACWLFGLAQRKAMLAGATPGVMLARGLALLIVVGALAGLGRVATLPTAAMQPGKSDGVVAFSLEALATARAAGKPVFVDMTAAWCITCMVNERVALDAPSVRRAFAQRGVVFMKGDWTNRNGTISAFLHEHGREGVPLYVYYPPHGDGQVLPQVLTPGVVAHVLDGRES
ncbi:protein-disulfide reductase DsbD family protein [Acidomonas methanolica]|nr:thioredoxin family protein [Acidomonas methanolica]MBU2655231.1 thioredoxin family protein [Acidomonas methanolica]